MNINLLKKEKQMTKIDMQTRINTTDHQGNANKTKQQ